jgi:hypothetical protein
VVPRVTVRRRASPSCINEIRRLARLRTKRPRQGTAQTKQARIQQGNSSVFTVNGTWKLEQDLCTHDTQDHNYEQKRNVANKILTSRRPLPVTCVRERIHIFDCWLSPDSMDPRFCRPRQDGQCKVRIWRRGGRAVANAVARWQRTAEQAMPQVGARGIYLPCRVHCTCKSQTTRGGCAPR